MKQAQEGQYNSSEVLNPGSLHCSADTQTQTALLVLTPSSLQVKQVRVEYEYKLMLQPQQLNEQLREANGAKEAAEQALYERIAELNQLKATAAELQERFLADMEAQHAAATEQLEAAYDTRFAVCHPACLAQGAGRGKILHLQAFSHGDLRNSMPCALLPCGGVTVDAHICKLTWLVVVSLCIHLSPNDHLPCCCSVCQQLIVNWSEQCAQLLVFASLHQSAAHA